MSDIAQPIARQQRQRRKTLTHKMAVGLPRTAKRYTKTDPEQRHHQLRIPPTGPIASYTVARDIYGRVTWSLNGTLDVTPLEECREITRAKVKRIKAGLPPVEPPPVQPESFAAVFANWMLRHVLNNGLRTASEIERSLKVCVMPYWADRDFAGLRRSDVAALLDHIQDRHGRRMADVVRARLSSMASWYGERHDSYTNPFLRHRPRVPLGTGARSRVLSDDELRRIWAVCEQSGAFGRFVQLLLLLGQRRGALARMKWSDISPDGVWIIRREEREKNNAGALKLPPLALEILSRQPRLANNDHVFFARIRADGPTTSFADNKKTLDRKANAHGWVLHDARRWARSAMSRCGISSEVAEKILGHVTPGVEGTYNRHDYFEEKRIALEKLASLIERIVDPPEGGVVVPLRAPVQP